MRPTAAPTLKEPAGRRIALVVLLASAFLSLPLTAQVTLTLSPSQATVKVAESQDFTAVVTGTSDKTVKWKVCDTNGKNCVGGGNSQVGTVADIGVDAEGNHIGRYTAPAAAPAKSFCQRVGEGCQVTVKAKLAGRKKNARADVLLTAFPSHFRSGVVRIDSTPKPLMASLPTKAALSDDARKQVFVANRFLGRVEVFSTSTRKRLATLWVPSPTSLDLAPDGHTVYVGTDAEAFYILDAVTLQIRERVPFPHFEGTFTNPRAVVATNNGTVLIMATSGPYASPGGIVQWNPATGNYVFRSDLPPIYGAGIIRASGDHRKILIGEPTTGGGLVLYDSDSDTFSATATFFGVIPHSIAANSDGSRFAIVGFAGELIVYDGQLQEIFQGKNISGGRGAVFSRDGSRLYVFPGEVFASANVYSTTDYSLIGRIPDLQYQGALYSGIAYDIDENGIIYAIGDRGLLFIDGSSILPLSAKGGAWLGWLDPLSGRQTDSTPVTVDISYTNTVSSVYFGERRGKNVSLSNRELHATAPPSPSPGPVDFRAILPNGWHAVSPEGFSYGPWMLYQHVMGGPADGGVDGFFTGYGLGENPGAIQVQVGGSSATDIRLRGGASIDPFPFPVSRIKFRVPAGTAGRADIAITTSTGTTILPKAFHYLSHTTVPLSGEFFQGIIDSPRQRLYLTDRDKIQVISTATLQPLPPILMPYSSPDTRLTGIALTPDNSKIVVADKGNRRVIVLEADNPASAAVYDASFPIDQILDRGPLDVAPTSTNKVFLNITFAGTGCGLDFVRELDLATGIVVGRNDMFQSPCVPNSMRGTPDGTAVYWNSDGAGTVWHAESDSFYTNSVNADGGTDLAVAADGNRTAFTFFFADGNISPEGYASYLDVDVINFGLRRGQKLHSSGSLLYVPIDFGVEIVDTNRGYLVGRYLIPDLVASIADALMVDETGRRLYLVTTSGVSVLEFDSIPLSIGSVSPGEGSTAGGTDVTIRGSGFQNGAVVKFGETELVTTFVDENTLQVTTPSLPAGPVRVTIVNPDGEEYYLDAAFRFLP